MLSTRLTRWSVAWMGAALMGAAQAAPAGAQTTTTTTSSTNNCGGGQVTVELMAIGTDSSVTGADQRVPNGRECEDGVELSFDILGLTTADGTNLVVYSGPADTNCADKAIRESSTVASNCVRVTAALLTNQTRYNIKVPLMDGQTCTRGTDQTRRLTFIPSASDPFDGTATKFGCYTLQVDGSAPAAPTSLNSPKGERLLTLKWEPSGDASVQKYIAFFDNGADGSGGTGTPLPDGGVSPVGETNQDCPSDVLFEGATLDPADLPQGIGTESKSGMLATSVDIEGSRLEGAVTPVAVAAVDKAGNVGPLSEVVCMEIVDTVGFWEDYRDRGGQAEGGCACSLTSTSDATAAAPFGLAMLGLWLRARRRRA